MAIRDALSFCETCGRPGGPPSILLRTNDRSLTTCARCGLLACAACARDDGRCAGCVAEPASPDRDVRPTLARPRRGGTPVLIAAALVVAAVAFATWAARPFAGPTDGGGQPQGAVLGEAGAPASQGAGTSQEAGATPPAGDLEVAEAFVHVWRDALDTRRGQALFVLRNTGADAVEVDPGASTYTVRAGERELASGSLAVAIPPVLAPGEEGYAVASFVLLDAPGGEPTATAEIRVAPSGARPVELDVGRVQVDASGATLAVDGVVRNRSATRVERGVVAVLLLKANGEPVLAMVDEASASVLEPDARRPFRATDPAVPLRYAERFDSVRALAWGVAAGSP